jgi:hypothetical protein
LKLITNSKTDTGLSSALGISPQTLSSWRGRESIPYAICINIAEQHGISLDWLLTGAGPQLRTRNLTYLSEPADNSPWETALLNQLRCLSQTDQHAIELAVREKKRIIELERQLEALTLALGQQAASP